MRWWKKGFSLCFAFSVAFASFQEEFSDLPDFVTLSQGYEVSSEITATEWLDTETFATLGNRRFDFFDLATGTPATAGSEPLELFLSFTYERMQFSPNLLRHAFLDLPPPA